MIEPDVQVICCGTEHALLDELSGSRARVLVVELGNVNQQCPSPVITVVRERFPKVRILAYCWLSQSAAVEILVCARAGLDELALRGFSDVRQVVRRVLAEEDSAEDSVFHDLSSALPTTLAAFVRVLLTRVQEAPNVEQLARMIGRTPRSLQRATREHGCCTPAVLIECVRVLFSARLLTHSRLTLRGVAERSGYRSVAEMRRALRRCAVPPPEQLNGSPGYARAREAIEARIHAHGVSVVPCSASYPLAVDSTDETNPLPWNRSDTGDSGTSV